ncbi:MAG: FecR domain-containing protein, partial [Burkholderiales bacterium]|nr:FecR domain-containing protein [Burkholderiales bacterium]
MLGLLLGASFAEAKVEGSSMLFSPGKGITPLVKSERGNPQAGQRFVTSATEIREVLFADGTSLTLGPNSEVLVESVNAEEGGAGGGGQLTLRLNKGLIRIAGGMSNNTSPILIKTANGDITLDAASAVIQVSDDGRTRASLLFGRELRFTSRGRTQSLQRPGFELVSTGTNALDAARQSEDAAAKDAASLSTAQLAGQTPIEQEGVARAAIGEITETGLTLVSLATEDQPGGRLATPPNFVFSDFGAVA